MEKEKKPASRGLFPFFLASFDRDPPPAGRCFF
jgi:hypothetical protein